MLLPSTTDMVSYTQLTAQNFMKGLDRKDTRAAFFYLKNGPGGFHATLNDVVKIVANAKPAKQSRGLTILSWVVRDFAPNVDLDALVKLHEPTLPEMSIEEIKQIVAQHMATLARKRKMRFYCGYYTIPNTTL